MSENNQYYSQRLLEHNIKYLNENNRQPLVYLKSFGCQQNVSDGEKIKGMLSKVGYDFTDSTDNAQVIIYNTCAVRENAEDRVFGTVGDLKHVKEQNPDLIIGVWMGNDDFTPMDSKITGGTIPAEIFREIIIRD